jgi:hypothetical protein
MDATVGPDELRRSLDLLIAVEYSPPGGECRPGEIPFVFQLDAANSTIDVEVGQSLPPDFSRYPQVLLPGYTIGVQDYDPEQISLAYKLALALQRVSADALDASFTTLDRAAESDRAAVLVTPWAPELSGTGPLLSLQPTSVTNDSRIEQLRMAVDLPHAVLETFEADGRDRLMLTWSAGSGDDTAVAVDQADGLLAGISTREKDFDSLYGDTYISSTGAPPLSVSVRGGNLQSTPRRESPNYLRRALPLLLAGLAVAGVVLAMAWLRSRRSRSAESEPDI